MAFIKVKGADFYDGDGHEMIINTEQINTIEKKSRSKRGDYRVNFSNSYERYFVPEEAKKIFEAIGVSLD